MSCLPFIYYFQFNFSVVIFLFHINFIFRMYIFEFVVGNFVCQQFHICFYTIFCSIYNIYKTNVNVFQQPGHCICKPGFGGRQCNRCAFGYYGYPYCKPCPCNPAGSVDSSRCDGNCICKVSHLIEFEHSFLIHKCF